MLKVFRNVGGLGGCRSKKLSVCLGGNGSVVMSQALGKKMAGWEWAWLLVGEDGKEAGLLRAEGEGPDVVRVKRFLVNGKWEKVSVSSVGFVRAVGAGSAEVRWEEEGPRVVWGTEGLGGGE